MDTFKLYMVLRALSNFLPQGVRKGGDGEEAHDENASVKVRKQRSPKYQELRTAAGMELMLWFVYGGPRQSSVEAGSPVKPTQRWGLGLVF